MNTLHLDNNYLLENDITIEVDNYVNNNNLAILLIDWSEGDPDRLESLTINLGVKLPNDYAIVDIVNLPEIENFIEENNLGKPTGVVYPYGYSIYPEYKFNINEVKKYSK